MTIITIMFLVKDCVEIILPIFTVHFGKGAEEKCGALGPTRGVTKFWRGDCISKKQDASKMVSRAMFGQKWLGWI